MGKAVEVNEISEVIAPGLLSSEDRNFSAKEQCMLSVFHQRITNRDDASRSCSKQVQSCSGEGIADQGEG